MSNCDCSIEVESRAQARVLIVLLAINAAMFVAEIVAGILAESTGLIADSLDMLADAAVYMRASWIFSRNDVIANVGVISSGFLVYASGSRWPDLIVGLIIVAVVFRGGRAIIADARQEQARTATA